MLWTNQGKDDGRKTRNSSWFKSRNVRETTRKDSESCHCHVTMTPRYNVMLPGNVCGESRAPSQKYYFPHLHNPITFCLFQGSVFFALPDGNGLLYNVTGSAEGPKPVNNIQREVPCKTPYTEMLTVTNWLRRPQRFGNFSSLNLAQSVFCLQRTSKPGLYRNKCIWKWWMCESRKRCCLQCNLQASWSKFKTNSFVGTVILILSNSVWSKWMSFGYNLLL